MSGFYTEKPRVCSAEAVRNSEVFVFVHIGPGASPKRKRLLGFLASPCPQHPSDLACGQAAPRHVPIAVIALDASGLEVDAARRVAWAGGACHLRLGILCKKAWSASLWKLQDLQISQKPSSPVIVEPSPR